MNKFDIPKDGIFNIGNNNINKDIKSDITKDSNNTKDIIIEFDSDVEKSNAAILLRLKPSTVKALDDLAWEIRKSRNYTAQILLEKALANAKIKKK